MFPALQLEGSLVHNKIAKAIQRLKQMTFTTDQSVHKITYGTVIFILLILQQWPVIGAIMCWSGFTIHNSSHLLHWLVFCNSIGLNPL